MKIIDISWPLSEKTTTYKNKKDIHFKTIKTVDADNVHEMQISLGTHSGTHIDAPAHFLSEGVFVDKIGLDTLIGQAQVIDCSTVADVITKDFLTQLAIEKGDIVLFKTRNSNKSPFDEFDSNFVYIDADAARYLASKEVKAVGIDYLGIERNQKDHDTHKILFKAHITIIEGLRLALADPGIYLLVCLPLALIGVEAAPARALLITD